jgi:Ca2+-dependent lipid-binding protein, contains C2 domain
VHKKELLLLFFIWHISFSRLKPDTSHRKCKTSVKWKNLNPVFNEEFVFDTKMTELPKQALEITVWDKDYGKSNDYLGEFITVYTITPYFI